MSEPENFIARWSRRKRGGARRRGKRPRLRLARTSRQRAQMAANGDRKENDAARCSRRRA